MRQSIGAACVTARSDAAMAGPNDTSTSQTMRALLRLRELIVSGEFGHGDRMSELPLVARLGVSRTPVRLALAELEHEGLLRALPGGGYVVREFTQADIVDACELRGVLEGTAARFAAERGAGRRELRALRAISDEIAAVVHLADYESFERFVGLNDRFHAALVAMAKSPQLERALDVITALPFASASAFVMTEAVLPESREILVVAHNQHLGLIEAIEQGQGARAEALAREHARIAIANLKIALNHQRILEAVPGHSLFAFADDAGPRRRGRRRERLDAGQDGVAASPSATRAAVRIAPAPGT
jgi:GntR family transcriptional regulator of vanillate catabolism